MIHRVGRRQGHLLTGIAAISLGFVGCGPASKAPPLASYDAATTNNDDSNWRALHPDLVETSQEDSYLSDSGSAEVDVASPATATDGWQCPTAAEKPCGGALEGSTWTIVDFCPEDPVAAGALFEHPFGDMAACQPPGGTVKGQLVDTGEISFESGEMIMDIGGYAETTYTFLPECLAAAKPGGEPATSCVGLSKADFMQCSYAPGVNGSGLCTCVAKVPKEGGKSQIPYAVVGGTVLKAGNEFSAAYCIQGDRLLLDVSPHIVSWRWWLLKRK